MNSEAKFTFPPKKKEQIGDELESLFSLQAKTLSWVRRLDPDLYDPKPSTLRERDNPALLLDPAVYEQPGSGVRYFLCWEGCDKAVLPPLLNPLLGR